MSHPKCKQTGVSCLCFVWVACDLIPPPPAATATYLKCILGTGLPVGALNHLPVDAEPEHRVGDLVIVRNRRRLGLPLLLTVRVGQGLHRNWLNLGHLVHGGFLQFALATFCCSCWGGGVSSTAAFTSGRRGWGSSRLGRAGGWDATTLCRGIAAAAADALRLIRLETLWLAGRMTRFHMQLFISENGEEKWRWNLKKRCLTIYIWVNDFFYWSKTVFLLFWKIEKKTEIKFL